MDKQHDQGAGLETGHGAAQRQAWQAPRLEVLSLEQTRTSSTATVDTPHGSKDPS